MSATIPAIPSLPGPDWTHEQGIACEAAVRAHMAEHGPSPEAYHQLATIALGRCAYRPAVAWLSEALTRWPEIGHPLLGLNGRLQAVGAALHGGMHEAAEHWVADIAAHVHVIDAHSAEAVTRFARGTGLQPELLRILVHCLEKLDPGTQVAEVITTLVREYEEVAALASAVRLISLGSGCYSWMQPNRFMLRRVCEADLLMPFNLCASVEAGIATALEDGLAGFLDPSQFDLTTIVRGIPVPRHRRYAVLFNHDCDDAFLADGMAELHALCATRARAFLQHAVSGPRVFLCLMPNFADAHRLERALAELMQDNEYRLLLLASQHGDAPDWPAPRLRTTRMVHVPIPAPGYNWAFDDNTPEGYCYDLTVRRVILDAMRELADQ